MTFIGGLFFSGSTGTGIIWAGIWTRPLTVPEMDMIDCEPGDADVGYDEFELVGHMGGNISCSLF